MGTCKTHFETRFLRWDNWDKPRYPWGWVPWGLGTVWRGKIWMGEETVSGCGSTIMFLDEVHEERQWGSLWRSYPGWACGPSRSPKDGSHFCNWGTLRDLKINCFFFGQWKNSRKSRVWFKTFDIFLMIISSLTQLSYYWDLRLGGCWRLCLPMQPLGWLWGLHRPG